MEHTMEEMQNNMTIVYNLRTGSMKGIYTGIQSMEVLFGEESEDYAQIWGVLVMVKDDFILENWTNFKYDVENSVMVFIQKTSGNYVVQPQ